MEKVISLTMDVVYSHQHLQKIKCFMHQNRATALLLRWRKRAYFVYTSALPSLLCKCKWRSLQPRHTSRHSHTDSNHKSCFCLTIRNMSFFKMLGLQQRIQLPCWYQSAWSWSVQPVSHLCCRFFLPTLQDSCTRRNRRGRNTSLRYCRCWSHSDSHLNRDSMTKRLQMFRCVPALVGIYRSQDYIRGDKHVWTTEREGIVILEQSTNTTANSFYLPICVNTQFPSSDVFNAVS